MAVALAEHRKWPDNSYIQQKCLVYAGFIAHYAQDQCQPLHTTIHFNGRAKSDGSSSHSGIHEKVDALIEYLDLKASDLAKDQKIEPIKGDLMEAILSQLQASHALVDKVYELEADLPNPRSENADQRLKAESQAVIDFVDERTRESVRFTASLYLTAWQQSSSIRFESWLDRAALD